MKIPGKFPSLISKDFEFDGSSWTDANSDIVFPGLGWISVTARGKMTVKAYSVEGKKEKKIKENFFQVEKIL